MVCKIDFCSEFPDISDNVLEESREEAAAEEEHRQLQSVMHFTQTQEESFQRIKKNLVINTISSKSSS